MRRDLKTLIGEHVSKHQRRDLLKQEEALIDASQEAIDMGYTLMSMWTRNLLNEGSSGIEKILTAAILDKGGKTKIICCAPGYNGMLSSSCCISSNITSDGHELLATFEDRQILFVINNNIHQPSTMAGIRLRYANFVTE